MTDSETASDSIRDSLENGVATQNKDVVGGVSGSSKKDEDEKKSVEVVMEEKDLEDLKVGVDKDDVGELKDVENEKIVETTHNIDEKDCGSTKDGEEKNDVKDLKDIDDNEQEEKKDDARVIIEGNEKKVFGEAMYVEGHNDANNIEDGMEKKGTGVADELEAKELDEEGQKDAKEAKELDENVNDVKSLEEEKGEHFEKTKDEKMKMIVEETKHEEDKVFVEEQTNGKVNDVVETKKDVDCENNVQSFDNETNKGEKNNINDVKTSEKEEVVEEKVHKDDNVVEQLQYGENKQVALEINVGVKNNLKPMIGDEPVKVKKKPRNIGKVKAETGKKKVLVNDESEETIAIRGLEDEKEDIGEGMLISEDEDVAAEEEDDDDIEKKSSNKKVATKRSRRQRSGNKSELKDKSKAKEKKESGKKSKELMSTTIDALSSPIGSSRERPVRERKTVERLVEVIEKEPNKAVIIEKGQGTPLKDIPNVAYKLARKKPTDLKFLHQTLFGRRGKAVDFRSNILQFSGFAWHEAEEKQRAKIKEKLDKCIKDNLLDLCDLLDLTVTKTTTRKEEIIVKLVDFLEAPHATTDVILAEKEQSGKTRKPKRFSEGSGSRSSGGTSAKRSRKKSGKAEGTPTSSGKIQHDTEDEDEEENTENGVPDEDDAPRHSESDAKENELVDASNDESEDEDNDEYGKETKDREQSPKKQGSGIVERRTGSSSKKVSSELSVKSPVGTPSSHKQIKVKNTDTAEKVFTRKKKKGSESPEETQASDDEGENEDVGEVGKINEEIKQSPKRQGSSISKKRKRMSSNSKKTSSQTVVKGPVKTPSSHKQTKVEKGDTSEKVFTRKKKDSGSTMKSNSKAGVKDNSGKKAKGKITGEKKSSPNKTDLRKTICDILKEVDFNTATFTDILKKLAAHYNMDLTPKKAAIKQMIQEELTKMAEEADSEEEEKEETDKEETRKPSAKKVKT